MIEEINLIAKEIESNPEIEATIALFIINLIKKHMDKTTTTASALSVNNLTEPLPKVATELEEAKIADKQPLFLPHGSVRALITLILLLATIASYFFSFYLPKEFYILTTLAVGYYIGYRTNNTQLPIIKS